MKGLHRLKLWDWETITKVSSAFLAIATVYIGILQYRDQDERQYREKIYQARFSLYTDLLDLTARLSITSLDSIADRRFAEMSYEFDRLYYGKMNMIQDSAVQSLMIEFKKEKEKYLDSTQAHTPALFQDCAIRLGLACKRSLQRTQAIRLSEESL